MSFYRKVGGKVKPRSRSTREPPPKAEMRPPEFSEASPTDHRGVRVVYVDGEKMLSWSVGGKRIGAMVPQRER